LRREFARPYTFARPDDRCHRYHPTIAMIPALPHELLENAVETMCYFCTALGVLLAMLFSPR
jgi:hypothetical protein